MLLVVDVHDLELVVKSKDRRPGALLVARGGADKVPI